MGSLVRGAFVLCYSQPPVMHATVNTSDDFELVMT